MTAAYSRVVDCGSLDCHTINHLAHSGNRAMPVYLIATLDTKGIEIQFVREQLESLGVACRLVNVGCVGEPTVPCEVSASQVFAAAGTSLAELRQAADRGRAIDAATRGVSRLISEWYAQGEVDGVLSIGGSAGTTIGTAAMRELPIGVPKLMVSTLASGQTRPYVGSKDILMMNAVVDVAGINRISRRVLSQAARAMAGMVKFATPINVVSVRTPSRLGFSPSENVVLQDAWAKAHATPHFAQETADRPLIAATMFGVTTPCVEAARQHLEVAGYEVLVFHATGTGGQAMESLIREGLISGVLDITTTELADELVGGILSAGPDRLTAAGQRGIPQVISVGALDMVNFGPRDTVPDKFRDRQFYQHNATVTLMRTTVAENAALGREIGRKAAASTGPVTILLPREGVSAIDRTGQPFDDPAARAALFEGIRATAGSVSIIERPEHLNDPGFALAAAEILIAALACTGAV